MTGALFPTESLRKSRIPVQIKESRPLRSECILATVGLAGKTAIVTGASKGLGKAIASTLAASAARVLLVSRDAKLLQEAASQIRQAGGESHVFPTDVTDESQVAALAKTFADKFGKLHILVNNAGVNIRKPVVDYTLGEWRKVLDTNLTSVFLMCHYFVPRMMGNGYGRIINMTSVMSHIALPGRAAYCASKTGLMGFTRALALELAPEKITVNGISPGVFATEMNAPLLNSPELSREFLSKIPMGRWGQVEEVAKLALYLCSEEAGLITGTDVIMDGGWMAQ